MKTNGTGTGAGAGAPVSNPTANPSESEKKSINVELWQACAGPLVNLPAAGTHVVYFPQGHSEQVAASMKKDVDAQTPNYPNLPSKLLCLLHNVTLHADPETDEVYAQMTLQPVPSFDKEALLRSDLSMKQNKPQPEFFCKTLTASDTSTHGGFSVPRRAAEKIFPPLNFSMQPPAQELVAKDLHDNVWTFRHIYRGQPKRHLLTTGWSLFVSGKRLFAGDSVLFIRDDKQQLLLGVRRANRQPANLSSSVLSSDSMQIGILAAAAHAAANNSPFTVFYNPRASPSEFVIPLAKYYKAVCSNQVSLGMRFRMMFETEESGTRRYMGTVTGISDLDPLRWKNSQWRNLLVNWDESTAGDKRNRVSTWEIEPVTAPFFICPTPSLFRPKRPRQPGMPDDDYADLDSMLKRTMPWLGGDVGGIKDMPTLPGLSLVQWMNMQQNSSLANSIQPGYLNSLSGSAMQNLAGADLCRQLGLPGAQVPQQNNMQFSSQRPPQQSHLDQLQKLSASQLNPLASVISPQQQMVQAPNVSQQEQQSLQLQRNLPISIQSSQSLLQNQSQQRNFMAAQTPERVSQQMNISETQIQLQYLQKLQRQQQQQQKQQQQQQQQLHQQQQQQQQQQTYLTQQSAIQQPPQLAQMYEQQKQPLDVPQNFSRSMTSGRIGEFAQATASSLPHSNVVPEQLTRTNSQNNVRLTVPPEQVKLHQQQPGLLPELQEHGGRSLTPSNPLAANVCGLLASTAGVGQSGITDEVPSCSTSPSANNSRSAVQPLVNGRIDRCTPLGEINQSSATVLNSNGLKAVSASGNLSEELRQKSDMKPSLNASKNQNEGFFSQHNYPCASGAQMEYLDTSSSATSMCISQNDARLAQNANQMSFNSQPVLFRDTTQGIHDDHSNTDLFASDINNHFGMQMMNDPVKGVMESDRDFLHDLASTGEMLSGYDNLKESQPEPSSSIVSQSFGVPDMTFNSRDSAATDNGFTNRGAWGAAQQMPRMRTYTKVYKRGAVGRSIDIARYSGYEELKQDLARRFGIEGQLEDRQRIGWKLVYVDHENDVLLVGDDPWEEFVSCVRCIKILSPQEVQQMSLDGDLGNSLLQNQACSSSDGGNVELAS